MLQHAVLGRSSRSAAVPLALALLLAALTLSPAPRCAQTPTPALTLTSTIRSEVIEAAAIRLAEGYVDADTGRQIGEALRAKLKAGAYDGRGLSVVEGQLAYPRTAGGLSEVLVGLGGNRFALGATQLLFEEGRRRSGSRSNSRTERR